MADAALALQLFMSGDDDIVVDDSWAPHPGQPMPQMTGCFIGKRFGAGALSFNQIFDLVDDQGHTTDQAIKVCKPTLAARRSLAHEWKMFKSLSLLADEFVAARSHFLQAHRVVKLADGKIAGIVMEKANGRNVDKTLSDHKFCNVRYVIALLRDLLVGLDVAQRVLGFSHYDLKLDNVMEQWTHDPEAGKARVLIDAVPQFKIFDFGTAVIYPDPFAVHTVVDEHQVSGRPAAASHLAEQRPNNRRGRIDQGEADRHDYEYSTPFMCVRVYQLWGRRMGDVFRVLRALCRHLDDRTWPLEDLELVSLLFTVLEHTTNSRRLKARFEPRATLLQRLYGAHAPAAAAAAAGTPPLHRGLSQQQSLALIQQHSSLVLQGSMALGPQGSAALPSPAEISAFGRQQKQQQHHHPALPGRQQLQGVAEAEEGVVAEPPPRPAAPLRINTTKIPEAAPTTPPAATSTAGGGSVSSALVMNTTFPVSSIGQQQQQQQQQPPPSPTGVVPPSSSIGGQYTPRRSTEVPREELGSSNMVPGMAYVRLAKAPAAAAAGAAAATTPTGTAPPASPFAVSGVQEGTGFSTGVGHKGFAWSDGGGTAGRPGTRPGVAAGGSSADSAAGHDAAVAGVQQMVSPATPEQRKRQQQRIAASLLHHHDVDRNNNSSCAGASSAATPSSHTSPHRLHYNPAPSHYQQQQQQQHPAIAAATAAAAATAPANHTAAVPAAASPAGAASGTHSGGAVDPYDPPAPTSSSSAAPGEDIGVSDQPGWAYRADSAGTIVAKQPPAPAAQQSVLGRRRALRGVTAQQLLMEPIVQSLLSKV